MNQPLRIEPVTLETAPPNPRFDLADEDAIIATVYGADEDEAHKTAILFANAALMRELLRELHAELYIDRAGRAHALNYDRWLRDVREVVRRIEEA